MLSFAFTDHTANAPNNVTGSAAVSHDVGKQLRHFFGSDFVRREQALPGAGVRYDRPNRIVDFMCQRRRQFAHQCDASRPGQFHVLALML